MPTNTVLMNVERKKILFKVLGIIFSFSVIVILFFNQTNLATSLNKCLLQPNLPATKNDVVLLSLADEGRVDISSIIYPISTLRESSNCKIVLFIDSTLGHREFFNEFSEKFDIELIIFEKPSIYIANYRIKLYSDYLETHTFDRVIHADISDIYYQLDPFKLVPVNGKLLFFKEGCPPTLLKNDEKNLVWYKECYPNLNGLKESSPIINAGFISGGYDAMKHYLRIVWNLMRKNTICDISKFGPDQAVVEYAYNNDMFNDLIGSIEYGPIYCIHVVESDGILYDMNNCILPFIHGRPPYYPQSLIDNKSKKYSDLYSLIE
ncbi:Glycosyltransferase [Entamoeba marina]